MATKTDHHPSSLPSDTYDGPLEHVEADTYECPRCIADRAVERALEGK